MKSVKIYKNKYTILDSLLLPLRLAPLFFICIIIIDIISASIPVLNTYVVSSFINNSIDYLTKSGNLQKVFISILFIILLLFIKLMTGTLSRLLNTKLSYTMKNDFQSIVIRKRALLKYEFLENDTTCDLITRAGTKADEKVLASFHNLMNIIKLLLSILGILVTLSFQLWWAGLVILLLAIPLMYLAIKSGKENYEVGKEVTAIQRKYLYFKNILIDREHALERSLMSYSDNIKHNFIDNYEEARVKENKVKRKWFIKIKIGGLASSLLSYSIAIILIPSVIKGSLSIGMYLALVSTILELVAFLSWQISHNLDELAKNRAYFRDFTDFMNLDEIEDDMSKTAIPEKNFQTIEFRNVYFKYPGQEHYILKGVNLTIHYGKSYSIVGINGAGKTTIRSLPGLRLTNSR